MTLSKFTHAFEFLNSYNSQSKDFFNRGRGLSAAIRIQATPPLQTSLLLSTYKYHFSNIFIYLYLGKNLDFSK